MNNKRTILNVTLAILGIGLWVWVFINVFESPERVNTNEMLIQALESSKNEQRAYEPQYDYKDPFNVLSKRYIQPKKHVFTKTPIVEPSKEVITIWPQIHYHGILSSKHSKDMVGALTIDGRKHLVRHNDSLESFIVDRISRDSISISDHLSSKTFFTQ